MQSKVLHRYRHRYRTGRLLITALVILLLVPAGVLALRSLWVSLAAADELSHVQEKKEQKRKQQEKTAGAFAGTPAAAFPEGEAGIVPPPPQQVGNWSPEQVDQVLQGVRRLLITARLDPHTQSGDTQAYVGQLAESTRSFIGQQVNGKESLSYLTRLAPNTTLAQKPRVKGTMRVSAGDTGQLVIVADYVWAYALNTKPAAKETTHPSTKDSKHPPAQLVAVRSVERYEWYPEQGYLPQDRGIRPSDGELNTFNMDCAFAKQGLLGLPRTPSKPKATAPLDKVLDPKTPLAQLPSTC